MFQQLQATAKALLQGAPDGFSLWKTQIQMAFLEGPFFFFGTKMRGERNDCKLPHKKTYECFQKIGVPQNGWFVMESPIKMEDLGGKPTIFGNIHIETPYFDESTVL